MKKKVTNCEDCIHYDYSDEDGAYECTAELDEDEMIRYIRGGSSACPYFRFYDEYKFVQKQN